MRHAVERENSSIVSAIGNTRLVELVGILPENNGRIFAKAAYLQPGASVKDVVALEMIRDARSTGQLRPGQTVVEMTSGNMGAGLAVVCAAWGHPFVATISVGNSRERVRMLRELGAEIALVPQVDGTPGNVTGRDIAAAATVAQGIALDRQAFYIDQFNNPNTVRAHERVTGPEIWRSLEHRIDAFVAAVGTGGTLIGTARFLKARDSAVKIAAVEPLGAEVLAGNAVTKPRHLLQGTGYGTVPPLWESHLVDTYLSVSDEEASEMMRRLGAEHGIYVGYSSGANVCGAVKLFEHGLVQQTATVATVLCDSRFKYSEIEPCVAHADA